jgi:2-phospho-L-lactate guanylyltransferase
MTLWAIVPVKPLRRGKSRLAGALNEQERADLNRLLLARTLKTLIDLKEVEEVLVVSRDSSALALARDLGARTVQEDGAPALNTALKRATVVAQVYASRGVLVIPADLPLLSRDDVLALLQRATDPPVVVIAPDRHQKGTNALLLAPANLIEYDFGGNSFERHCERARKAGARLEVVSLPSLGLDLDLPEDLELVRQLQGFESGPG